MKEKKKPESEVKPSDGSGGSSIFDVAPEPENKNVSVSSGPYIEDLPVSGTSVGEIRKKYADRFDIDKEAQAIVNGDAADEDYILKAGEALMFVRHAGEKGAHITIDGNVVTADEYGIFQKMPLEKLMQIAGPGMSTKDCVLPTGIKAVLSRGPITIWVWEKAPCIQRLSWIAEDSPRPYGPNTKYRNVRISLPYLVIFAVFSRGAAGLPYIVKTDECFFRNEPLKSLDDELCYPALLNCSKLTNQNELTPLSWICTQYLKATKQMNSGKASDRFYAGFDAVRYCLLETSFNLSSEHHEGNSWYGASKKEIKAIETIAAWEKSTAKDPMFVLDTKWIPAEHSVKQVAERIFKRTYAVNNTVKTSSDLARIVFNNA